MINLGARNGAEPTLSMLNQEVIAQHGSSELPVLHPHTAGARACLNSVRAPRASVDSCATVSERLFARSPVGSGEMTRTSHTKPPAG
jgi:hypothetical protein